MLACPDEQGERRERASQVGACSPTHWHYMSAHLASGEDWLGGSGGRVELQVQEPCRLGVVVCQVRARACLASLASQVSQVSQVSA